LTALLEGRADLAACSRALTDEDVGIEATLLATDAIAVAVHPSNPVEQLTSAQLRLIFEGQITSWAAVGGADETIAPIGREAASGTRVSFESALGITSPAYGQELGETGIVRTAIASCSGAVGYLSASYADDSVKIIAVDGALPENDAVQSGAYPLSRPFLLCRRADDTCREVIDFLTYATGDAAQRLKQLGLQTPSDPTEAENFPSSS
jgi:phosphate transport system substrate-binding protein